MEHAGPILIAAPSGWGKTVLASQVADSADRALWSHIGGRTLAAADLSDLEAAARQESLQDRGQTLPPQNCLVIDDVALPDASSVQHVAALRSAMQELGWRLIVTSRNVTALDTAATLGFHVLGRHDLALDPVEAEALRAGAAVAHVGDVAGILADCGGHPALFSVLLRCDGDANQASHTEAVFEAIDRLAVSQLEPEDLSALMWVSLVGRGRTADADESAPSVDRLIAVESAVPLLTPHRGGSERADAIRFTAHGILFEWALSRMRLGVLPADPGRLEAVLRRLLDEGDLERAFRLAMDMCLSGAFTEILRRHGRDAVSSGMARSVSAMFERLPLSEVVSDPQLMMLWAEALIDLGRPEDGFGKARAARILAEHSGDTAMAAAAGRRSAAALLELGRWHEAKVELQSILAGGRYADDPAGEARLRTGLVAANVLAGEHEDALAQLSTIATLLPTEHALEEAVVSEAMARGAALGDFAAAAKSIAPLVSREDLPPYERVLRKGALAEMLTELGRLERAAEIQQAIGQSAIAKRRASFLMTRGRILAARGDTEAADVLRDAVRCAIEAGNEPAAAQVRTHLSVVLRADGDTDGALSVAERAYESLCVRDYLSLRRMAALEIAASLLVMGDVRAARAWAEPLTAEGSDLNRHRAMRTALILAECDRRQDLDWRHRFDGLSAHIVSGNSNWQTAMYCRSFPVLLPMLAHIVGVGDLPAHMLRMILPADAEAAVRAAGHVLEQADRMKLGERLLGRATMSAFMVRGGQPICHVQLFGGLEITIDGRSVRERDWRKKKSRLLFAMLVARQGQDVPREQVFDHLWPDLDHERAKNNFYVVWSMVKAALMGQGASKGPCPYIESGRGRCRIVREAVRSDIDEIEDALALARQAENDGELRRAVAAYERVRVLYRGELLPGDLYDDWFAALRDHYRYRFIDAMARAAELLLDLGEPIEAVSYARRGLVVDKSREDLYQLALRGHIAAGQRSPAIELFIQCKRQLSDELGLDPSEETLRLYSDVLGMEERSRYSEGAVPTPEDAADQW